MLVNKLEKWVTNSSKYLVDDRWIKLRADSCVTPEGYVVEPYYVLEYSNWANCFVLDNENNVIMVKHYRHGIDEYVAELVSGGIEPTDASAAEAIRRELKEEVGYVDGEIVQVGVSYPNPANQTNKVYSFIAYGGACKKEQALETGETLYIMKLSFEDFTRQLYSDNMVYQSMHLATIFFALKFINASTLPEIQQIKIKVDPKN